MPVQTRFSNAFGTATRDHHDPTENSRAKDPRLKSLSAIGSADVDGSRLTFKPTPRTLQSVTRPLSLLLLALATLLLALPERGEARVMACERRNVQTEYDTSDVVFRGRVSAVDASMLTMTVLHGWKGVTENDTVRIRWPLTSRRSSCLPEQPRVGDERVVLAVQRHDDSYRVRRNTNSRVPGRFLRVQLNRAADAAAD